MCFQVSSSHEKCLTTLLTDIMLLITGMLLNSEELPGWPHCRPLRSPISFLVEHWSAHCTTNAYIYIRWSISDNISNMCVASCNMCLTFLRARRDRKVRRGEPHLCDSYRSKEALPTARGKRIIYIYIYIYITLTFKIDLSTLFNQSHLLQVSLHFRLLIRLWITWSNVTVLLNNLHLKHVFMGNRPRCALFRTE